MSANRGENESEQFEQCREATSRSFNAPEFIGRSRTEFIGEKNEKQNDSTPALYSGQNDEKQQRRLNQQACANDENNIAPVSSTAEPTSAFLSLVVQVATDDLPAYAKQNASVLTFPEKMMILMMYVERISARLGKGKDKESIEWKADGRTFVISHVKHFTSTWLPMFFGQLKFSSFTRKLYRWGFKKITVCLSVKDGQHGKVLCFGNENFQRDNLTLLTNMRSVTEPKYRRRKSTTSVEPETYSHLLLSVPSSQSRTGQSMPQGPPVTSHHLGHTLQHGQPRDRSLTTANQMGEKAPTYEEQLVAQVISSYQSQHNVRTSGTG